MKKCCILMLAMLFVLPFAQAEAGSGQDNYLTKQLAAGAHHALAILQDGSVAAAGENGDGQCNVQHWENIVQVAAGAAHSVGLRKDGKVIAAGRNDQGQCNVENWTDIVFIACGDEHTVGLKKDGTVVATGIRAYDSGRYNSPSYDPCFVDWWQDVVLLAAGGHTTFAISRDGLVMVAGELKEESLEHITVDGGEITAGKYLDEMPLQIAVLEDEALLYLYKDGTLGWNGSPQALYPMEWDMCPDCYPGSDRWLDFGTHNAALWTDITELFVGGYHVYGLKTDGTVVAAGDVINPYAGYVGLHAPEKWEDIVSLAAGKDFVIGVDRSGKMYYAGLPRGELSGVALWQDMEQMTAVQGFAMGLDRKGMVHTWSSETQLWRMWDDRDEAANWKNIVSLEASLKLAGGIDKDGKIRLILNPEDKYGLFSQAAAMGPARQLVLHGNEALVLLRDGRVFWLGKQMEAHPVPVLNGAVSVALGENIALGVMEDGRVQSYIFQDPLWFLKAPGENGSLLPSDIAASRTEEWRNVVSVAIGGDVSYALTEEGKMLMAGNANYGQEAALDWENIVAISASPYHIAGLKADGTVVAAGWNEEIDEEGWMPLGTKNQCNVEHWKNVKQVIATVGGTIGVCCDGSVLLAGADYADVSPCLSWKLFDGEYQRKDAPLQTESARVQEIAARKAVNNSLVQQTLDYLKRENKQSFAIEQMHPEYDKVYAFHNGYAMVTKDGCYGLVDEKGKEILPPVYDFMNRACNATVYASTSDWLYGFFVEDTGKLIPPAFGASQDFEGEYVNVMLPDETEMYMDRQGNLITEEAYKALQLPEYQPEKPALSLYVLDDYWKSYEGAYGYTDAAGNMVIDPIFQLAWEFEDGLARVNLWGYEGYINEQGEIVGGFEGLEERLTQTK